MNKFKPGDYVEVIEDVVGYKYNLTKAGTLGVINEVHDTWVLVLFQGASHRCTFSSDKLKLYSSPTSRASDADSSVTMAKPFTPPTFDEVLAEMYLEPFQSTYRIFPHLVDGYSYPSDEERQKRKQEGRCEECGELRPMSVHGLLDCPNHPSPGGKQ